MFIDEQLRFADGLAQRGYYTLAIEEYKRLVEKFPDDPLSADMWSQLAGAYSACGKIREALNAYDVFFSKFPEAKTVDAVRINYAVCLCKTGRDESKKNAVCLLLEIKNSEDRPELIREAASYNLGKIYANSGEKDKAEAEFRALASKNISSKEHVYPSFAVLELVLILKGKKQNAEASGLLKKLSENRNAPEDAVNSALQILASIYCEEKKFIEASESYGHIAVLFPDSPAGREALYRRLECLFFAGEYGRLINETEKTLGKPDIFALNRENILFLRALALQKQGFYAGALKTFSEILTSENKNSDCYSKAAYQSLCCLISDKKYEEAVKMALSFISDPQISPESKLHIADFVCSAVKNPEDVISFLEKARASAPLSGEKNEISLRLAGVYFKSGDFQNALLEYDSLAGMDTKKIRGAGLMGSAKCLRSLQRNGDAVKIYRVLINDFKDSEFYPEALLNCAETLISSKADIPEAEKYLGTLKENYSKDPFFCGAAIFYLGYLSFAAEKLKDAENYFSQITQNPDFDEKLVINANFYLIWCRLLDEQTEKGLAIFKELAEKPETLECAPPDLLVMLGNKFSDLKDAKPAKLCYETLLKNPRDDCRQAAFTGLGVFEYKNGSYEKAESYLRNAVKISSQNASSNAEACAYLGEILIKNGNKNEAVLFFEKCIENPANKNASARARLGLAKILSENDESVAAANRYAMSVFVLSDNRELCEEAMLLSAELSIKLGKPDEARTTLDELVRRYPQSAEKTEVKKILGRLGRR